MDSSDTPQSDQDHSTESTGGLGRLIPYIILLLVVAAAGGGGWWYYKNQWLTRVPQDYTLTDQAGKQTKAKLLGHSGDIIKWTPLPDGPTHYSYVSSFSTPDQAYLRNLKPGLTIAYPLDTVITDKTGHILEVSVIGRGAFFFNYQLKGGSSAPRNAAIAEMSPPDQALLKALPSTLSFSYPLDLTIVTQDGRNIPAIIQGRSDQHLKFATIADGSVQSLPLGNLTTDIAAFVHELPVNLKEEYPVNHTIHTATNQTYEARIEGRTDDYVRFTVLPDGPAYFLPTAALSPEDKLFVRDLPINMSVTFPFNSVIANRTGVALPVEVQGRSAETVKVALLSDHSVKELPLNTLSDADQAALRALPLTFQYDPTAAKADSPQVALLRTRLVEADGKWIDLNSQLSGSSSAERSKIEASLARVQKDLGALMADLAKADGGGADVKAYITTRQRDIFSAKQSLTQQLTDATPAKARANNQKIEALTAENNALSRQLKVLRGQ